jgi:urease accessory protein
LTALLSLVQWLSPAFPTGGFAYSHGMETAITAGAVHDAASAGAWIRDVLQFGAGHADAVLLVHALRPADADHDALDALARALATSAERLVETVDQGAAFARTVSAVTGRDLPLRTLPVAVGEATRALVQGAEGAGGDGLAPLQIVEVYLHAFAANLCAVATRTVPLGQTEAQAMLAALHPVIAEVAGTAAITPLDGIATSALGADIAALQHETLDVRLFRT